MDASTLTARAYGRRLVAAAAVGEGGDGTWSGVWISRDFRCVSMSRLETPAVHQSGAGASFNDDRRTQLLERVVQRIGGLSMP